MSSLLVVLLALSSLCSSSDAADQAIIAQAPTTLETIVMVPVRLLYSLLGMTSEAQLPGSFDLPSKGEFHETKISARANDGSDLITIVKSPQSTLKMTHSQRESWPYPASDTLTIGSPASDLQSTAKDILGLLAGIKLSGSFNGQINYEADPYNMMKQLANGAGRNLVEQTGQSTGLVGGPLRGHAVSLGGQFVTPIDKDGRKDRKETDGLSDEQPVKQFDDNRNLLSGGQSVGPFAGYTGGSVDDHSGFGMGSILDTGTKNILNVNSTDLTKNKFGGKAFGKVKANYNTNYEEHVGDTIQGRAW